VTIGDGGEMMSVTVLICVEMMTIDNDNKAMTVALTGN